MYAIKPFLIISTFLSVSMILFVYALSGDFAPHLASGHGKDKEKDPESTSYFVQMDYFRTKDGLPVVNMNSLSLSIEHNKGIYHMLRPIGRVFSKDGAPYDFSAVKGKMNQKEEMLYLWGRARLYDSESDIKAKEITYHVAKDLFVGIGDVQTENFSKKTEDYLYVESDKVRGKPKSNYSHYIGNVVGRLVRKKNYEEGVDFKSDEAKADLNQNYLELLNNVFLSRSNYWATSRRGEMFLENYNKKLKYFILYDDVVVKQSFKDAASGDLITRKAYGEKLEGFAADKSMVLTGFPRVIQGKEKIMGNVITMFQDNEVIEVDDAKANLLIK
jgi:lipopolysaccharide export system protein LptA